ELTEKVRHYVEVVQTSGDFDAWDDYLTDDLRLPDDMPDSAQGLEGFKAAVKTYERWIDFHVKVEDIFRFEDKVAIRNTISGTQLTEFPGFSAGVGKRFEITEMLIAQLRGDKICRFWRVADRYLMLQQLGGGTVTPIEESA